MIVESLGGLDRRFDEDECDSYLRNIGILGVHVGLAS